MLDLWPAGGWVLPLPFALWCVSRLAAGEVRWEQMTLAVVMPGLAYATRRTQRLFLAVLPLALLGLTYDAMRYVQNVGLSAQRVHDCDLRALESRLFGLPDWTVHDWLQAHPSAWLDRLCAVPYGTFLFVTVGFALWLYVRAGALATQRFAWAFFVMSLAGFVTYHLYPAAPPWYFHQHGCTIDLATRASEGPNLARVDAWLGVGYFHGLYGRSSDVFGSVPSLHVAYPALILLEGWRWQRWAGRAAALAFAAWMAFAAVYLDHHWIVDVLLGWMTCGAAYILVYRVSRRTARPPPLDDVPGPEVRPMSRQAAT
jgi:membrane-associated phospholipid phosphatase